MIMAGSNIISSDDTLKKIQEEYLYNSLRNPNAKISSFIRQLRIVYNVDRKQYSQLKRSLPYVVCGIFTPPYRKIVNFAYTDRFIVDIDGLQEKGISLESLRKTLCADTRTMMCFSSPSEDGMKIMFRLSERCYDPSVYSVFYKRFLRSFSAQYNLEQAIDSRTSDVTRACFVSHDENAFYNPLADAVNIDSFVDLTDTSDFFDCLNKSDNENGNIDISEEKVSPDPDKETMEKIKNILNPKLQKAKENRDVYVPIQLDKIIPGLTEYLHGLGISVTETINIQYGKKIRMSVGMKSAEVNLFYGKRGFTVVVSPRNGTNMELNDLTSRAIQVYINENGEDRQ